MPKTKICAKFFAAYSYSLSKADSSSEESSKYELDEGEQDFYKKVNFYENKFKNRKIEDMLDFDCDYLKKYPFLNIFLLKDMDREKVMSYLNLKISSRDVLKKRLFFFDVNECEDIVYFIFLVKYDLVSIIGEKNRFLSKMVVDLEYFDFLQKYIPLIKEVIVNVNDLIVYEKYMEVFLKKLILEDFKFNLIFYDIKIMEKMISNYFLIRALGKDVICANDLFGNFEG